MKPETTPTGGQAGLALVILRYFRRILLIGLNRGPLAVRLEASGREVHVLPEDALQELAAFPTGYFDAIVLGDLTHLVTDPAGAFCGALPWLSEHGAIYLAAPCPFDVDTVLSEAGLARYFFWTADAEGTLTMHLGPAINWPKQAAACVVMAVRRGYDPVVHARALFKAGQPDLSLELLANIPETFLADTETKALAAAERQLCFLAWDRATGPEGRLARFSQAQREFYIATTLLPRLRQPYLVHAVFWQTIGNDDMAARLLRSIDHAVNRPQLASYHPGAMHHPPEETAPVWTPTPSPPRVLIITHEQSDYGLDTLYDGLCTVLGSDKVVEFPWKPTLHGRSPEKTYGYPCLFNHPGEPMTLEDVCRQLEEGYFDFVFVVDTLRTLGPAMLTPLMEALGDTPLFIVDTWDESGDYYGVILEHIGRGAAQGYFKREMLTCGGYVPNTYPLPFAYPDSLIPDGIDGARREAVFWAGKRLCGLRSLYLDHLETAFGMRFEKTYNQNEYVQALHRARIGLNFFGLGFDTVRYWELPAHGCMLFSERPPIRIPHNFRDGESGVFFDDLADFERKLRYYLAHPDEVRVIARAGHEHLKRYHTASARARQLLGRIQGISGRRG